MNTLVTMPFDFVMPDFSEHLKEMNPYAQFVFASLEDEFADAVWMLDMATAVAITEAEYNKIHRVLVGLKLDLFWWGERLATITNPYTWFAIAPLSERAQRFVLEEYRPSKAKVNYREIIIKEAEEADKKRRPEHYQLGGAGRAMAIETEMIRLRRRGENQ